MKPKLIVILVLLLTKGSIVPAYSNKTILEVGSGKYEFSAAVN